MSPVAQLPSHLPHSIPQILINRDPVAHHNFDVCLLGDGDSVVKWLCDELAKTDELVDDGQDQNGQQQHSWDLDKEVPVSAKPATNGGASSLGLDEEKPNSPAREPEANGSPPDATGPEQVGHSHVWLFPGANRESRWVESVRRAYGSDADEEEDDDDDGDKDKERASEDGDKPVELPASLAPGVIEGEGSDGPDSVSVSDEDDDDDAGSTTGETGAEPVLATSLDKEATPSAASKDAELQRIAPSFLHSAADLA